jgi:hypothetical protein
LAPPPWLVKMATNICAWFVAWITVVALISVFRDQLASLPLAIRALVIAGFVSPGSGHPNPLRSRTRDARTRPGAAKRAVGGAPQPAPQPAPTPPDPAAEFAPGAAAATPAPSPAPGAPSDGAAPASSGPNTPRRRRYPHPPVTAHVRRERRRGRWIRSARSTGEKSSTSPCWECASARSAARRPSACSCSGYPISQLGSNLPLPGGLGGIEGGLVGTFALYHQPVAQATAVVRLPRDLALGGSSRQQGCVGLAGEGRVRCSGAAAAARVPIHGA